ncbi:MAG: RNA 2',3'-cyclic phosphodiesterase [Candidatus Limnocylindrales bacterium]
MSNRGDDGLSGRGGRAGGFAGAGGPVGFRRPEDDPAGTSRLFVAVPVADDVRASVGELMVRVAGAPIEERLFGQPRWVRVEGLHLTLRFLGATPDERRAGVAAAVGAAARGVAPFAITLNGGGAFPNPYRPRVLWIGIHAGSGELARLARRLNDELRLHGWPSDDRPFEGHLTLARTDGVAGADGHARRLMEASRDLQLTWQADRLVLYRSIGGRGPARYEALAEALLGSV